MKNGIKKTKQAIRKKMLPTIDQKFPTLAIKNAKAETIKNTHPIKFILSLFIPTSEFSCAEKEKVKKFVKIFNLKQSNAIIIFSVFGPLRPTA